MYSFYSRINKNCLAWLMCGIGMLFYFYNFFLRVSPSAISTEMMEKLHLTAYQFGNLSAFYYFAYTPMQIPAGILYDKFGIRLVQCFAVSISIIGLFIFIHTDSYYLSCAGRFLVGFGCAFAYIGVMKTAANWLPPKRFALAAGLTTTCGMSAAIFSTIYLTKIVTLVGYQHALWIGLLMGISLICLILFFLRNQPADNLLMKNETTNLSFKEVLGGFNTMLHNKQMWLIGVIGCLTYLPSSVFLDLWGIPYLKTVYHLNAEQAAYITSYTFMGWIVGGPLIGWLSDKIERRILPLFICYSLACLLFFAIFYFPSLSLTTLKASLFLIGICCSSHPICIAIGKENNPLKWSAIAVAFSNCLTMVGGMIFQPFVGKIIDLPLALSPSAHFTYALTIIPFGLLIALGLLFFIKETFCSMIHASSSNGSKEQNIQEQPLLS